MASMWLCCGELAEGSLNEDARSSIISVRNYPGTPARFSPPVAAKSRPSAGAWPCPLDSLFSELVGHTERHSPCIRLPATSPNQPHFCPRAVNASTNLLFHCEV